MTEVERLTRALLRHRQDTDQKTGRLEGDTSKTWVEKQPLLAALRQAQAEREEDLKEQLALAERRAEKRAQLNADDAFEKKQTDGKYSI
jgi:hypothetical protein